MNSYAIVSLKENNVCIQLHKTCLVEVTLFSNMNRGELVPVGLVELTLFSNMNREELVPVGLVFGMSSYLVFARTLARLSYPRTLVQTIAVNKSLSRDVL